MGSVERRDLAHVYQYRSSPFWNFARTLRDRLSALTGCSASIAWSNLCKLGVAKNNPDPALQEEQRALAVETLQQEMRYLNPSLVVFVSEGYADDFVYQALGIEKASANDFDTHETEHSKDFYSRKAAEGSPALLWVQHPQIKTNELLDIWIRKAEALIR